MMVQVPMLTVFVLMAHSRKDRAPQQLVCSDGLVLMLTVFVLMARSPRRKDKLQRT